MCEVAGCGYEGMHVHFWGAVDVLIYDLRGKEELSPAGEKRHLLDHYWGPEHACQNLVNEQRMRAGPAETGRDNREVRKAR